MKYNYKEKLVQVTRREFIAMAGIAAAAVWTGAYTVTDIIQDRNKYIKLRAKGLYTDDEKKAERQSHHNTSLMNMYKQFAGEPMSPLAEELFHTKYIDRSVIG